VLSETCQRARILSGMTQAVDRSYILMEPAGPSPADMAAAIRSLPNTDLLRLCALARLRARALPQGVTWADLLNEAVLRALDGSRRCPPDVPVVAFLAGIMRSLCNDYWRRSRQEGSVMLALHSGDGLAPQWSGAALVADPERTYAAAQALAAIDRLFAADPLALKIVAGLSGGMSAAEIRRHFCLTEVEYDTIRRRMRRALLRQGMAGPRR
jgi:DNA-directed RNA polymerase specialized sigma24 family protein